MTRKFCTLVAFVVAGWAAAALADDYADGWSLPLGTQAPAIAALDQSGAERSLDSLVGERGLLLFLVRSADW
ncbi:MAG: hypothetical protein OXG51_05530 [Gammaproteobacteria bacterium]|nr:hypothetical protein [Gammaproteobacteria bacterium]